MPRRRGPAFWIKKFARKYGVDPSAALAVAMTEGGLRWGAVGDAGTSFGPFQLHVGGALPAGRGPGWANSPAGIEYAIRSMAQAGAAGLVGRDAIEAIVRKFERPADPDTQVKRALRFYSQLGGSAGVAAKPLRAGGAGLRRSIAREQFVSDFLSGGKTDPVDLVLSIREAEDRARQFGGTTVPPVSWQENGPPLPRGVVGKVLAAAHSQLGKPYVWGGESPQEGGFDCSGLIDWALRQAGIDVPGRLTTYSAMKLGRSVKGKKLKPGDMIITNGGKHMVLYVGGGRVIAAPRRGEVVQYQPLSAFRDSIVDVRRIFS